MGSSRRKSRDRSYYCDDDDDGDSRRDRDRDRRDRRDRSRSRSRRKDSYRKDDDDDDDYERRDRRKKDRSSRSDRDDYYDGGGGGADDRRSARARTNDTDDGNYSRARDSSYDDDARSRYDSQRGYQQPMQGPPPLGEPFFPSLLVSDSEGGRRVTRTLCVVRAWVMECASDTIRLCSAASNVAAR